MEKTLDEIIKSIGPVMASLVVLKQRKVLKRSVLVEAETQLKKSSIKLQGLISQIDQRRKLNQQP